MLSINGKSINLKNLHKAKRIEKCLINRTLLIKQDVPRKARWIIDRKIDKKIGKIFFKPNIDIG